MLISPCPIGRWGRRMVMLDNKLYLTSVAEFLRRSSVDCDTREGKVVVGTDLSKRKVQAPSPKLIHNAFQSVGLSVFAAGAYVITFIGFRQHRVMFKLRTPHQGCPDFSYPVWTAIMCLPNLHFMLCLSYGDTQCYP
jgi:hypothetical protein